MRRATTFQHGVASGDPLTDRVILWTRITTDGTDPVPVEWTIARDEGLTDVVASGRAQADAEHDWSVHADPTGLEPDTHYWYRFRALDENSRVGRTRTLPVDTRHLRFAMVSCAKFNAGFFNAYQRIAARDDLQFLLHLGDYIYEASNTPPASQTPGADIGRPFEPLNECVTLDDYRARYNQYHRDPDVQTLHAAHPLIGTVDDHEFADGAWRDGATEHKPEYGPWSERKATAFRVREEWLPVRRPDPNDPERTFRTVSIGELADIMILDTRTRRDEPVGGPPMQSPERSALGAEQREWLFAELEASDARWRLLANPSVMGHTWRDDLPDDVKQALKKVKLLADDMLGPDFDQWDGYPVERAAVLKRMAETGDNDLVVLSGDVHVSLVLELEENPFDDHRFPIAIEFVTPSLTSQNLDDKMGWPRRADSVPLEQQATEHLSHWRWADFDSHGYVVIDVNPARVRGEWWHLDTVLERTPNEELSAAFEIPWGTLKVERVA